MKAYRLVWLGFLALSGTWGFPAVAGADCARTAVSDQELTAHVLGHIRPLLETDQLQLELLPIGDMPAMTRPQVRLATQGLRSRVAVELHGRLCGHERTSSVTVWFKARALHQAWVYGRNVRPGQAVADTEPRRAQIDVAALQVPISALAENLDGLWLNESANAGMPILKRHLQPEPLVRRDAVVDVIVYGPGLMLRTQGRVMRAGGLGDSVPVLVDGATSSLLAVVSGRGEVHVQR